MDLLSILSILYVIETKPIKNNFVYIKEMHILKMFIIYLKKLCQKKVYELVACLVI